MTPKPSDSSEIASILYDFRDRPISDPKMLTSEQAKAKLEALVVRGRVEEIHTIKDSRDVQIDDDGNAWCDFCHMELIEGSEQDCACIIISRKRIAERKQEIPE
jgi:hypothetical protein